MILMHPKEYKKEKNGTGHMTSLQLENSEIIVGVNFTNNTRVNNLLHEAKDHSFLLYPGQDNLNLSERKDTDMSVLMGKKPYIFILDGTWPCVRKMLKISKNLQGLKRVSFDNKIKSEFVIKQQPESLCLSTIESVYSLVNLLKAGQVEQCDTKDFLVPFKKMLDYQIACIQDPNNKNYRSRTRRTLNPKNRYKKHNDRNTIFEKNRDNK